ncbi:MAG TPA: hypothetical protein VMJ10_21790 [Kofleriaceae bacterium]|nr:hypothetical protein [Kofleriaceae bacterium]
MKKNKDPDNDLRVLDIITREVGLLEYESGHVRAEDKQWANGVVADVQAKIGEYRRARLPKVAPPIKKAEPISKRLKAMPRVALEALYAQLHEVLGPRVQVAFRNLSELSDNDLRRLIQKMEKAGAQGPRG